MAIKTYDERVADMKAQREERGDVVCAMESPGMMLGDCVLGEIS